jgi:hypothetical protein
MTVNEYLTRIMRNHYTVDDFCKARLLIQSSHWRRWGVILTDQLLWKSVWLTWNSVCDYVLCWPETVLVVPE